MSGAQKLNGAFSAKERRSLLELLLKERAAQPASQFQPLSFAQERQWFLDRFQPGLSVYNMATNVPIPGPLNIAALERCLDEIVQRHNTLRTTFRAVEGRPQQVVSPRLSVPVP